MAAWLLLFCYAWCSSHALVLLGPPLVDISSITITLQYNASAAGSETATIWAVYFGERAFTIPKGLTLRVDKQPQRLVHEIMQVGEFYNRLTIQGVYPACQDGLPHDCFGAVQSQGFCCDCTDRQEGPGCTSPTHQFSTGYCVAGNPRLMSTAFAIAPPQIQSQDTLTVVQHTTNGMNCTSSVGGEPSSADAAGLTVELAPLPASMTPLPFQDQFLVVPKEGSVRSTEPWDQEWMLIPRRNFTLTGTECGKIGSGMEAWAAQSNRCQQPCIGMQIDDVRSQGGHFLRQYGAFQGSIVQSSTNAPSPPRLQYPAPLHARNLTLRIDTAGLQLIEVAITSVISHGTMVAAGHSVVVIRNEPAELLVQGTGLMDGMWISLEKCIPRPAAATGALYLMGIVSGRTAYVQLEASDVMQLSIRSIYLCMDLGGRDYSANTDITLTVIEDPVRDTSHPPLPSPSPVPSPTPLPSPSPLSSIPPSSGGSGSHSVPSGPPSKIQPEDVSTAGAASTLNSPAPTAATSPTVTAVRNAPGSPAPLAPVSSAAVTGSQASVQVSTPSPEVIVVTQDVCHECAAVYFLCPVMQSCVWATIVQFSVSVFILFGVLVFGLWSVYRFKRAHPGACSVPDQHDADGVPELGAAGPELTRGNSKRGWRGSRQVALGSPEKDQRHSLLDIEKVDIILDPAKIYAESPEDVCGSHDSGGGRLRQWMAEVQGPRTADGRTATSLRGTTCLSMTGRAPTGSAFPFSLSQMPSEARQHSTASMVRFDLPEGTADDSPMLAVPDFPELGAPATTGDEMEAQLVRLLSWAHCQQVLHEYISHNVPLYANCPQHPLGPLQASAIAALAPLIPSPASTAHTHFSIAGHLKTAKIQSMYQFVSSQGTASHPMAGDELAAILTVGAPQFTLLGAQ